MNIETVQPQGKMSPEEFRDFYGDLSDEEMMRKVEIYAQMMQSGNYSEVELERWLKEQAVGYVQRELIAIMGTGKLTDKLLRLTKDAFHVAQQQPLDEEDIDTLNEIDSFIPSVEGELIERGQKQRLEGLLRRMREFEEQHGIVPPRE